ncbi:MAG: sodium:alanine symporter family protein, partial [Gemmatimonadetes bacterium]|nr:sodium:alanine symporter family protein [Gemmatimonadota bacterium]NIU73743.1 sodium:alanine symporter family protein [Gammaproteobacteria bacterium]NIX43883.1 sodium:alanine symporter family protein [Gemmatimonadota bacterium]NIY08100.1 sodium:alanine symporter family protein [Gemmatimonadota bacterium]
LERGLGGHVGKVLGVAFALFAAVAAFGIGNMVQSQAVSNAISNSAETFGFGLHPGVIG